MTETDAEQSIARLLHILDLRPTRDGGFIAQPDQNEGRLFGGIVLAQSIVAAGRTVQQGDTHSLHAYFLRAGRPATPISYAVERIRDGRNFTTRRVSAYQDGDMIFEATIGFVLSEPGISYQTPMPESTGPEGQAAWWESFVAPQPGPPQEMEMHRRMRHGWANPIDIVSAYPGGRSPLTRSSPSARYG
jgi:acyl-CoA thioesterase-2